LGELATHALDVVIADVPAPPHVRVKVFSHLLGESDTSFFAGAWDGNVVDGRTLGLPWYVDTRVLFYRRDLLAQAGWSAMPTTWEEWRRAMQGIKRVVGPDRYAIFLPLNEWNPPMILGLQAGSTILRDDATRGAFSGPEFRRAFDFFVAMFRDGLAPPVSNTEIANMYQEFARGYFAMVVTGPWNLGEFKRRLPPEMQGAWATAPFPGPDAAHPGVSLAGGSVPASLSSRPRSLLSRRSVASRRM